MTRDSSAGEVAVASLFLFPSFCFSLSLSLSLSLIELTVADGPFPWPGLIYLIKFNACRGRRRAAQAAVSCFALRPLFQLKNEPGQACDSE